jgi:hypothetical protein
MVIINYNIGENSRTIIADEVYSSGNGIPFSSLLTEEEKENPLFLIQDFFHTHYPLPESRPALNVLCLKATVGGKVTQWNILSDTFLFVKHFKRLMEAAYLVSKKDSPETVIEKITKSSLVPKHILGKGKGFSHIQAYLPSSTDSADSLDPIKNLKIIFAEKSFEELIRVFDQTYHCALYGKRANPTFYQDHLLHFMIFNVILDACHLIYVRTHPKRLLNP